MRLADFQVGHYGTLELLAAVTVQYRLFQLESDIHEILSSAHVRGEWFSVAMNQEQFEALVAQAEAQYAPEGPPSPVERNIKCLMAMPKRDAWVQCLVLNGIDPSEPSTAAVLDSLTEFEKQAHKARQMAGILKARELVAGAKLG